MVAIILPGFLPSDLTLLPPPCCQCSCCSIFVVTSLSCLQPLVTPHCQQISPRLSGVHWRPSVIFLSAFPLPCSPFQPSFCPCFLWARSPYSPPWHVFSLFLRCPLLHPCLEGSPCSQPSPPLTSPGWVRTSLGLLQCCSHCPFTSLSPQLNLEDLRVGMSVCKLNTWHGTWIHQCSLE